MLPIWTSLKICRLVKVYLYFTQSAFMAEDGEVDCLVND